MPYTKLIDEAIDQAVVIRKSDTKMQSENNDSFRSYCYYTNNPIRDFELFKVEMEPHASKESDGHSPKTQEYILVVRGELTLRVNAQEYVLKEGDSIYFDCTSPHSFTNNQETLLEFTDIIYYS